MSYPPRTALVTGAGSGLGRAIAAELMRDGFQVVLAGRHRETLEESLRSTGENTTGSFAVDVDVRDPESVARLFAEAGARLTRLDVLVNNAGVFGPPKPIDQVTWKEWQDVIETNVSGMFGCAQAAFRMMKSQDPRGGRIINNGSLSAHVPRPHAVAYTTSKHAVSGLTKAIALEGRPWDITCGQIDIGNAATDMTGHFAAQGTRQADGSTAPEPTIALEHVVRAVLYMANLPLDVSVPSLTVMATGMPFVGRG